MNTIPRVKEKPANYFEGRRNGSDPLIATARGRLQTRRSKLNDQINKELRLRAGAENLFKATHNKKLKETVALELSFVNSNLQVLKEEMAELNSSVEVYQNDNSTKCVPMIPLGLKETKEVEFSQVFKDYILEHYSEEGSLYEKELQELHDLRQACRTPVRSESGIELLYCYYNQLYFVEKRFFPPDRSLGVYFEWYDSLTGVPNAQRTVGFEKGSILFNIAALYTQLGARQDRVNIEGLDSAITNFQKAAGTFKYLHDNFCHAPSMDMQPQTLTMLTQLMLSQAQECVYEKKVIGGVSSGIQSHLVTAQEAAMVAQMYDETHKLINSSPVKDYVPFSWNSMVAVKAHHYKALSHYYLATALFDQPDSTDASSLQVLFDNLHLDHADKNDNQTDDGSSHLSTTPPKDTEERKEHTKAHLRQAILGHEEAIRLHNLCKQLRKIDTFQEILRHSHDRSLSRFSDLEEEDDFTDLITVPNIKSKCEVQASLILPDFSPYKVEDIFYRLGPLAIFSAKHDWSAPRCANLRKQSGEEFGFSVRGDSPVIIAIVEVGSLAQLAGVKNGDFLVAIGNRDVKWCKHEEVVNIIREAGLKLDLTLITPMDRNFLEPDNSASSPGSSAPGSPKYAVSPSGSVTSTKSSKSGKSSWMLKRRSASKDRKTMQVSNGNSQIILR